MPTQQWLDYVKLNVKADFETGNLFWAIRGSGRPMYRPIGCLDSNGYMKVQINKVSTYNHSVVYFLYHGIWPVMIDHINQIRNDNRPENLRETNHSENALNSKIWANNTTGVKGVSETVYGKFKVTKQGKHLGHFNTRWEAENAYNKHS